MSLKELLSNWLGLAPKPTPPALKTVTLPNGRQAVVDERGNFQRFQE